MAQYSKIGLFYYVKVLAPEQVMQVFDDFVAQQISWEPAPKPLRKLQESLMAISNGVQQSTYYTQQIEKRAG